MKRKAAAIVAGCAAAAGIAAFAITPGKASAGEKAPFYGRYFAHRGLHTSDGSAPENSLTAFRMAANVGYGVELDVHITADDQIVVFHDDDLERMTGVSGRRIWGTWESFAKVMKSPYYKLEYVIGGRFRLEEIDEAVRQIRAGVPGKMILYP